MVAFSIEYVKFVSYVVAGFSGARTWYSKEIKAGKKVLAWIEADEKKIGTFVSNEIKKI